MLRISPEDSEYFLNIVEHSGQFGDLGTRFSAASPTSNKEFIGAMPSFDNHNSKPIPRNSKPKPSSMMEVGGLPYYVTLSHGAERVSREVKAVYTNTLGLHLLYFFCPIPQLRLNGPTHVRNEYNVALI